MSKHIGREKADALTNKFYHDLFPAFKEFVDHEVYSGIWLPSEYKTDPSAWANMLRTVQRGMEEYTTTVKKETLFIRLKKVIKKFYERLVSRPTGGGN